jgi:hypothetical protein
MHRASERNFELNFGGTTLHPSMGFFSGSRLTGGETGGLLLPAVLGENPMEAAPLHFVTKFLFGVQYVFIFVSNLTNSLARRYIGCNPTHSLIRAVRVAQW